MCSDPDLMQAWKRKLQVSKLKKNCSGRDTTRVGEQGFVGCWGCSADKLQLVDAPILTHYGLADKKEVPYHDAFNDESLTVQPSTGKRCGGDDTLKDESVFGCYYNRKNICRKHDVISRVLANAIDTLATRLTVWVETLDKMVVARKDTFIACHDKTLDGGPLPAPPPRDRIVLLADVVGNPKMQYYHPCCVDGESSWCVAWPLRVPLRMSLASGAPRMGGAWQVVQTMTSDELCCALAKASPPDNWQFLSLDAQYLRHGPLLLTFESFLLGERSPMLTGHEEESIFPKSQSCYRVAAIHLQTAPVRSQQLAAAVLDLAPFKQCLAATLAVKMPWRRLRTSTGQKPASAKRSRSFWELSTPSCGKTWRRASTTRSYSA